MAFLALIKSGVSVAKASIPLPLISCSRDFLYSLCKHQKLQIFTHDNVTLKKHTKRGFYSFILKRAAKPEIMRGQRIEKVSRIYVTDVVTRLSVKLDTELKIKQQQSAVRDMT